MADKLEWMEQHPVLFRDNCWRYAADRQGYKVRADLVSLFEQYPEVLQVLYALRDKGDYSVACDLMARMLHPRAAVWWGYVCMLTLLEERKERKVRKPEEPEAMQIAREALKNLPFKMPSLDIDFKDPKFTAKDMMPMTPDKFPKIPKPPMNDPAAAANSLKLHEKANALRDLIPPAVRSQYETLKKAAEADFIKTQGFSPVETYQQIQATMKENPVVLYSVDYENSPQLQAIMKAQNATAAQLDGILAGIKAQFPELFPPTPEAAMLFDKAEQKKTADAIQAVYQWIVAPDEVNSQVALDAGNNAADKPEGMLAFTAFWSFGDLAPEGKVIVPTPPQLAPTGLASSLLLMSLEPGGPRKTEERWQLYYELGIEVAFARNLWPDALLEELAPHDKIRTAAAEPAAGEKTDAGSEPSQSSYKRWKS